MTSFKRAGLLSCVYRGSLEPGPTLRDLIESGERVIVMGEENVGDLSWFRQQFDLVSETPYEFKTAAQLRRNRAADAAAARSPTRCS